MYGSEVVVADLSGDGRPEVDLRNLWRERRRRTPGDPVERWRRSSTTSISPIRTPDSGNGIGAGAAPTVGDLDGDGDLEILVLTIDHGLDVYTVEGSSCNCTPPGDTSGLYCGLWPTGRGNYLRNGRMPGN